MKSFFADRDDYKAFWENREVVCYLAPLYDDWRYYLVYNYDAKMCFEFYFVNDGYLMDYIHFPTIYLQTIQAKCQTVVDVMDKLREVIYKEVMDANNASDLLYWKSGAVYKYNPVLCHCHHRELVGLFRRALRIDALPIEGHQ